MSSRIRSICLMLALGLLALAGCGAPERQPSGSGAAGALPAYPPAATATPGDTSAFVPLAAGGGYPAPSATARTAPTSTATPRTAPTSTATPRSAPTSTATPIATPRAAPTSTPTAVPGQIWRPAPGTTWQWQLTGLPVDLSVDAAMYDVDLFDNDASVVTALHARGRKAVCYISAGTWEDWRPDAGQFPASVKGSNVEGWPGERWLDIRNLTALGPIMEARMDLCKSKGFDGIEPDNVDGYTNGTGFPLTAQDQLAYNRFLAGAAHKRGLSVGMKNDIDQAAALQPAFDWAINEQCFQYDECDALLPFIQAGKAVFQAEYELSVNEFCPQARQMRFSSILKNIDLDAYRVSCD